jgi:hypothetical protein
MWLYWTNAIQLKNSTSRNWITYDCGKLCILNNELLFGTWKIIWDNLWILNVFIWLTCTLKIKLDRSLTSVLKLCQLIQKFNPQGLRLIKIRTFKL